jgi:hypothetical protein
MSWPRSSPIPSPLSSACPFRGEPKTSSPLGQACKPPLRGPTYKAAPEWFWKDTDIVVVDYLTDAKSAAAFLPEGMTTVPIAELPGYSAVKQLWAHYRDSSVGPYHEFFVVI